MVPEGSLPHSQVPATCPYPEPARSSPHPHIPLPENPSLYYSPIYAWVFQTVSFPQVSPPKPYIPLSPPHTHYMPRPPHTSRTILGEQYRSLNSSLGSFHAEYYLNRSRNTEIIGTKLCIQFG